jgi:hypothetical protein
MVSLSFFANYSDLGFPEVEPVATLRSIAHLFGASKNRCGIYLLEFTSEKFYIGQAVDVVRRFAQHRKNYDEIIGFSFISTPRKLLDETERTLIRKAEQLNLLILNTIHATNVIGDSDLDFVFPPEQQNSWLSSPTSFNRDEKTSTPTISLPEAQFERFHSQFRKFQKHLLFSQSTQLISLYINNCIPSPRRTEYSFWAVSCFPSTNRNSWPRLACVNIGMMEVFVVGYFKEDPSKIWGFLTVASDVLSKTYENDESLMAAFPLIDILNVEYRDAGQHQITLWAGDMSTLGALLEDKAIQQSAATLALRVMRKRATIYGKFHCKQLADLATRQNG